MKRGVTFVLIGDKKMVKSLADLGVQGEELAQEAVAEASLRMVQEAKKRCPVDNGEAKAGIVVRKDDAKGLEATVAATAPHSPYIEFGTGPATKIPPGFEKMAAQFRGGHGGTFKEGLENIRRWCKKRGIDEKLAWVIFMAILRRGLRPRPFFYPAFVLARVIFRKKIDEGIKNLKLK